MSLVRPLAKEEDRVGVCADGVFVAAGSREVMLGGEGAADDQAATSLVAGLKEGVSKMIFEPMVCLAQTVHISCINCSTISKQTETSFHLSLGT